jgi:hypothetical protein
MTNVIKHALKYQEFRRTLFLNLMGKDDFGRHRGQVLYGMELSPEGSKVRIRPGAFVTPYGTRFYWDVKDATDPSINTIDLSLLQLDGQGILDADNDFRRPIEVAIVARATPEEPARQPGIEAEGDMGANSIEFTAFVVAHSRATSHPTLNLLPMNPVEMDAEQTGLPTDYDYLKTWDVPSTNSTVALLAGNPAIESLGVNDVLLGYVIIGCNASGTPPRTLQSGGTWAPGVTCVAVRNAWQSLADFLGFDPLMGRVATDITGPIDGSSASPAYECTPVKFQAGSGAGNGTTTYLSPKFGTPLVFSAEAPWIGDWKDYRPPSFLKDGEQLIWQMRRLDVFLRLWMDRTGDQTLVQLIQDGGHADTDWQTPLHKILIAFTGQAANNLNAMAWPDGTPAPSGLIDNHVLKSGVAGHLDRGLAVLANEYGDTHASAIAALDWVVWHLLKDVMGFGLGARAGIDRAFLRTTGAWTRSAIAALTHVDAPHAGKPILVTGATTAYLDTEPVMEAVSAAARRADTGGVNLLRNPGFQMGDGNDQAAGEIPFWTRDSASAWSRTDLIATLQVKQLSVTLDDGNFRLFQRIDDANLAAILQAGELFSVSAAIRVTSGSIELAVQGQTAGGAATVFEAKSQPLAVTAGILTHTFSFKPTSVTGVERLNVIIRASNGSAASVLLAGVWAGPGVAPENPALPSIFHDFLSRQGGAVAAMRGDMDMGSHKLTKLANGVAADDGVPKGQTESIASSAAAAAAGLCLALNGTETSVPRGTLTGPVSLAQASADVADADQTTNPATVVHPTIHSVPRSGAPDHVVNRAELNEKAPLASPAFSGNPTAPTQTILNGIANPTRLASCGYVYDFWAATPQRKFGGRLTSGTTTNPTFATAGIYEFFNLVISADVVVPSGTVILVAGNLTFNSPGQLLVAAHPLEDYVSGVTAAPALVYSKRPIAELPKSSKLPYGDGISNMSDSVDGGGGSIGPGGWIAGSESPWDGRMGLTSFAFWRGGFAYSTHITEYVGGGGSVIIRVAGTITGYALTEASQYGHVAALGWHLHDGTASGGGGVFVYSQGAITDLWLSARGGGGDDNGNRGGGGGGLVVALGPNATAGNGVRTNVLQGGNRGGGYSYLERTPWGDGVGTAGGPGTAYVAAIDPLYLLDAAL